MYYGLLAIAVAAELANEKHYQELCAAAKAAGQEPPARIRFNYQPTENKAGCPWWAIPLAILFGASL